MSRGRGIVGLNDHKDICAWSLTSQKKKKHKCSDQEEITGEEKNFFVVVLVSREGKDVRLN